MTDKEFIQWIHDRLQFVHHENENMDYMHKLRAFIAAMPDEITTLNVASLTAPAAPHAQAEPVGKVTVVDGLWSSVSHLQHKPMPDGEHELYAVPVPQEAEQAAPAAVTDDQYEVVVDRRDLFDFLRAAWREGSSVGWTDTAESWHKATDYADGVIKGWSTMQPAAPAVTDAARDVLADAKGGA